MTIPLLFSGFEQKTHGVIFETPLIYFFSRLYFLGQFKIPGKSEQKLHRFPIKPAPAHV